MKDIRRHQVLLLYCENYFVHNCYRFELIHVSLEMDDTLGSSSLKLQQAKFDKTVMFEMRFEYS